MTTHVEEYIMTIFMQIKLLEIDLICWRMTILAISMQITSRVTPVN